MTHASSRAIRLVLLSCLASFGIYGGASCGSGEGTGSAASSSGAGGAAAQDVVVYEGDANDEALAALSAVDGPMNPTTYAVFDTPAEGAVFPVASPPTFTWHMNTQPGAAIDPGFLQLGPARPARRASLGPLLDLFGAERAAAAHGTPVNGLGYLLLFTTEKDSDLLRVFTTKTSYTPGPGALEIMKGVGGVIQVWILTGVFDNNALTADGGPFRGPWTSFEITP